MSNSTLINYTKLSPNRSVRNGKIKNIVIHHMAGNLSVKNCGAWFYKTTTRASSNYGIDSDGQIGLYVEERYRAWTTGNVIDHESVTIEVADDVSKAPWHSSDKAMQALIKLCADICKRNGIKALNYTGNKSGNLLMHKWYQATDCPGAYLESKFPWIANEVNKILNGSVVSQSTGLYRVRKTWADAKSQIGAYARLDNAKKACKDGYSVYDENGKVVYTKSNTSSDFKSYIVRITADVLNVRKSADLQSAVVTTVKKGEKYTIVGEKAADGYLWGKLKSGVGYIALEYTKRV